MLIFNPTARALFSCFAATALVTVCMAAGTVTISVSPENDVTIEGDDESNHVEITGGGYGPIVTGVDTELSVDGETVTTWVLNPGVRDLNLFMHKGDDVIRVTKMDVGRHIDARLGQGNDNLDVRHTDVGQHLMVREGTGQFADVVTCDVVKTGRNLWIDLGDAPRMVGPQGDVIAINEVQVGERMKLVSGIGGTTISVTNAIVEMPTKIFSGDGESCVSVADSTFRNNVTIIGGPNDDQFHLSGSIYAKGNFRTFLGYGDDVQTLDLEGSLFEGWTVYNGNLDDDLLIVDSWGTYDYDGSPEVVQFETVIAP